MAVSHTLTPTTEQPSPAQTILEIADLTVSYATRGGRLKAVDTFSFTLQRGETFGLVGESGSGKTTLANTILRLLPSAARVDAGSVRLDGIDLLTLAPAPLRRIRWERIALIPQGAMNSLNPVMRIRDQITDAMIAHGVTDPRRAMNDRIDALLESVGLPPRTAALYPHELSGGMKQRVCIAMAVALGPQVIIADEPTSALDVVVQRRVAETLQDVQRRLGATVILIGHDMALQAQLVDRLAIMYRGKLVELGPVRAVFKSPRHPYTQRLIASVPSLRHRQTLAERVMAADEESVAPVWAATPDTIPPLREVAPGHFAALE